MELVAALFVEQIDFRQIEGGTTRIDLTGAFFTQPVASFPTTLTPHLVALVRAPADDSGQATFVSEFFRDGEQIARIVQPAQVEPGKFGYRLVRPELTFDGPGTIEAHCTIVESGSTIIVPLSVIPLA
jgi:hypothetical protein